MKQVKRSVLCPALAKGQEEKTKGELLQIEQ